MKSRLLHLSVTTALAAMLLTCGGNGLPHSSQVTVTVTPPSATIAAGGSVALTGGATGFTAAPIVDWYIQESKDINFLDDCGLLTSQSPPQTGCPYGYVMFDDVTQFPSTATYYAPSTPGTYHVTFEASQVVAFDHLTKTVQAVITVQ